MRTCVYCGSEEVEYTGLDDGGGDFGSSVCDQYHCLACDGEFEDGCIDDQEDGFDAEAYGNKDISDDLGYPPAADDDIPY